MQQFESFAQMQRDAAMRVMDMQRRAQAAMREQPPPAVLPTVIDAAEDSPLCEPEAECITASEEEHNEPPKAEISQEETERALITAIILLLVKENADERLLFALLYILM